MKTFYISLLLPAVIFFSGCTSAESHARAGYDFTAIDRIAVIDVQGALASQAAKNQIADFLQMELLKKGYSPIERAQVQALLQEQKFQAGELTTSEGAARAGQILNVPVVMTVNIPKFSEDINMTAKMIDVEDGSILWMGSGSGTTGRTLSTIAGAAVGAAAGVLSTGEDEQVLGGVAGAVLGGVAGRALSPQQAKKAQEIIKKICLTMPSRIAAR
jgi:hypothetical protein